MTMQPQLPQQPQKPIYQSDLDNVMDRFVIRMAKVVEAQNTSFENRIDALIAQMRVDRQETLQRDQELGKLFLAFRDETRKEIAEVKRDLAEVKQELAEVKETQKMILLAFGDFRAEVMEAINDLRRKDKE